MKYKIFDWAGNDKSDYYGVFKSFEAAWEAIYKEFEHRSDEEFETQINEFYVERVKK